MVSGSSTLVKDDRLQALIQWLATSQQVSKPTQLAPASADASFRRYFRTQDADSGRTYVIMDAPPDKEDTGPFVRVSRQLDDMGITVPRVLEADEEQGFLLLTDLGQTTFLSGVNEDSADRLYRAALQTLVRLQSQGMSMAEGLPAYDAALLDREMTLFSDWLLGEQLQWSLTDSERQGWHQVKQTLSQAALAQPTVAVHRDYHSRNLMLDADDQGGLGVLDFQDAVKGPLTYDAVSLLRDCYVRWPDEAVNEWRRFYFLSLVEAGLQARRDWDDFVLAFDLMGMQRHLKAAGIFARLWHRDGKAGYLADIPNTLSYLYEVGQLYAKRPGMRWLLDALESRVLPECDALREAG
ncbi:aminoglycoside phosphotransferase [Thiomicrospira sp. WB1]|nr:aminoglycoside phosphotransferase [Thiomicrospira sp. WB1]